MLFFLVSNKVFRDSCLYFNIQDSCLYFNMSNIICFFCPVQEIRIAELLLRGIENLSDEEIAELTLLEEAEILETHISPLMEYYGKFFCKEPATQDSQIEAVDGA